MISSTFIPFGSRCYMADACVDFDESRQVKMHTPIVLIHGWGCSGGVWESLIPYLNKYADIITLDIFYDYKNADDCCEAIAKYLPEHCVLCGWSLGGMMATRLAGLYPLKIKALITLATNVSFVANMQWPDAMEADVFAAFCASFALAPKKTLLRFLLLQVKGDVASKKQLAYLKKHSINDVGLLAGLEYLSVMNNTKILSKDVVCPALLVFGEQDTLVPLSAANKIKKMISKCQEVVTVCGKGHVLPFIDDVDLKDMGSNDIELNGSAMKKNNDLVLILNNFLENQAPVFYKNIVNE
jgi:pimeloyl-ACP methyl ester carboxylesterase